MITTIMAVGMGGALAPPFPQKKNVKKRFETQLSNKYNMPYLIMIHCKCDVVLLTTGTPLKLEKIWLFA